MFSVKFVPKKNNICTGNYHINILSRTWSQESDVLILRNGLAAYEPMHLYQGGRE